MAAGDGLSPGADPTIDRSILGGSTVLRIDADQAASGAAPTSWRA